jgi:hypothetical protein
MALVLGRVMTDKCRGLIYAWRGQVVDKTLGQATRSPIVCGEKSVELSFATQQNSSRFPRSVN